MSCSRVRCTFFFVCDDVYCEPQYKIIHNKTHYTYAHVVHHDNLSHNQPLLQMDETIPKHPLRYSIHAMRNSTITSSLYPYVDCL
jgi:hypothetical protein